MGSIANSISSPVGVKLFKGGPYPDAGKGDVMEQNADQYMKQLAPIIAQIAQMAGVGNPQTGTSGQFDQDPYGLSPLQQGEVNKQAGIDREAHDKILSTVKAHLSAAGFGDSSTMEAAEAYLGQQLNVQLGGERIQAGENAYVNRNNALTQIAQLLGQGFGAKQDVTQYQAQEAQQAHATAMQQLGSFIALLGHAGSFGKSFPGYGSAAPNVVPAPSQPVMGSAVGSAAGGAAGNAANPLKDFRVPISIYGGS